MISFILHQARDKERIAVMRRFFILLIFMYFLLPLPCSSLLLSDGYSSFYGNNASFSFSAGRAYFDTGILSYGEISERGMVKAFSEPYGLGFSLLPRTVRSSHKNGRNGVVLSLGAYSFLFSVNERPLQGIAFNSRYADIALLFAEGTDEERGFHEDAARTTLFDTVYGGLDLKWNFLRFSVLMSYAEEIGFKSVLLAGLTYKDYSITITCGSLIALYEESSESSIGIRGSFGENGFLFIFSHSKGFLPVFSEDYLGSESYTSSALRMGNVLFTSEMEASFSISGKRRHSESFAFVLPFLSVGYDTEKGMSLVIDADYFSFGYRNESPFVEMLWEVRREEFSFLAEVSTDNGFGLSMKVSL